MPSYSNRSAIENSSNRSRGFSAALASIALSFTPFWWPYLLRFPESEFLCFDIPPLLWLAGIAGAYFLNDRSWRKIWWTLPFGLLAFHYILFQAWFVFSLKLNGGKFAP